MSVTRSPPDDEQDCPALRLTIPAPKKRLFSQTNGVQAFRSTHEIYRRGRHTVGGGSVGSVTSDVARPGSRTSSGTLLPYSDRPAKFLELLISLPCSRKAAGHNHPVIASDISRPTAQRS